MKGVFEKEKELLEKYRPVLGSFLNDQVQLEITALYALQSFIHGLQFPKGNGALTSILSSRLLLACNDE